MSAARLWTRDFITIATVNFITYLIFFLLMVVIASYAIDRFQASTSIAGLVSGIFVIGVLIGRLGTGRIIEDIGSRKILIAGTVSFIITSGLYFAAVNLVILTIIRLLHGIAYGLVSTAAATIVAKIIPPSRHGEGIGYYSMSAILATAFGPFIGILLIQHANFHMIFIVTTILAVINFAISVVVSDPAHKSRQTDKVKPAKGFHISAFLEMRVMPISLIALIIGFAYSVILSFISLYAQELHLEQAASFYFLVYALTVLVSRPFSGRLLDARGGNFVMYPCLLIFMLAMFLLSRTSHGLTLLLVGALVGIGYGNFLSCAQAIALKLVPSTRFGLATATFFIFIDLGIGVGPYLLGALVPCTGYRGLYLMMAGVIMATVILYYFLMGRKAEVKQPQNH